jgi:hypothetical protein
MVYDSARYCNMEQPKPLFDPSDLAIQGNAGRVPQLMKRATGAEHVVRPSVKFLIEFT